MRPTQIRELYMKKGNKIIVGVVASVIILAIAIPFIREYKIYSKAKDGNDIALCDGYINRYPDGRYLEEVLEIKEKIAFDKVKEEKDSYTCDWYAEVCPKGKRLEEVRYLKIEYSKKKILGNTNDLLVAINEYLHDYPNGKYSGEVNSTCDSLWDAEIERYNTRGKKRESATAVKFMSEMLQYMKKNRINSVLVDVSSHLQLKDYDEYDSRVREYLESTNDNNALSLSSGMISLKSNFSQADISTLMQILSEGVQKSLDKMFTPGFISVVSSSSGDLPKLHFDYTIKSQEERYGSVVIPHIWSYHEGYIVKNYLIGISIFFKAHYSIPGSLTTFDYSEKGEPANNINNVDDINDGYRRMTSMCFAEFSNKMARNMGLKETYFQDNEE